MIDRQHDEAEDTSEFFPKDRRVSRFYESEPRTRVRVEVAGKTHPGLVRPNNEDQYLAVRRHRGRSILATSLPVEMLEAEDDHAYALVVADGMGGHKFGELASLLAMRAGWELGGDEIKWVVRVNQREVEEIKQKAEVFFALLDEAIQAEIRENPRLAGMGTTMTICYTVGPKLFTFHAGDSRAYLFRRGRLRQLTRDHNLGQVLIDAGTAEADSEEVLRVRHVLTNSLGGPRPVQPEVGVGFVEDGDRLLLCTDGLNDMVPDPEIEEALAGHPSARDACEALIARALDRGGKDNVTVLVADYRFEDRD